MRLLRSFRIVVFALVLLSIMGLCAATRSAGLLVVGGVLVALSWYVTEGPRGRTLPDWAANVLIAAASLNLVVELLQQRDDVPQAVGRFIVWLTLIKLYQRKSPRDYAQLLSLTLLLMLIACLRSTDLLFAAVLLAYAVLGLYALLLFQLHSGHERSRAARLAAVPEGYPWLPSLQPVAGRRSALHLRVLAVIVAVVGLAASVFFFVLFPRDVGALVDDYPGARIRATGATAEVNLVGGTRITDSRTVVLTLRVSGRPPRDRPLYLRGWVLDRYEGNGRWHRGAIRPRRTLETQPPGFTSLVAPAPGPRITQEIEVRSPGPTLFAAGVPVAVRTGRPRRLGFDPTTFTLEAAGRTGPQRYSIQAQRRPREETLRALARLAPRPPDPQRLVAQFADFDPRVARFARSVLAANGLRDAPSNPDERRRFHAEAARILARHLRHGPFRYATDLRDVRLADGGEQRADPIVTFLLQTRRGHCEYFASALAAMCNTIGVPARLVTGYAAVEYDTDAGAFVVRESHAHAWVEVRTGPHRWETFDPTPPAALLGRDGPGTRLADRWRWVTDRMEALWNNHFVAFDRASQDRALSALEKERLQAALEALGNRLAAVNRAFALGPAGYVWMGIVALAVLIAVTAAWKYARRASRLRRAAALPRAGGAALRRYGFYLDLLRTLERAGLPKPRWQPPLQYAAALGRTDPGTASLVRELTATFYAARYGGRRPTAEELTAARQRVRELARRLGVRRPET